MREDHIGSHAIQLRPHAAAVPPEFAQVETPGIDRRDVDLIDTQPRFENGHGVWVHHREPYPFTLRKMLGEQARVPLHATDGMGEHTIGAQGDVQLRAGHPR